MQRPARRGGVQRAERAAEADARRRQGRLQGLREPSWAWGETVGLVARRGTCQAGSAPAPHPLLHEALPWCPRLSLLGMRPTSPQGSCSSARLDTKRVPLHPLPACFYDIGALLPRLYVSVALLPLRGRALHSFARPLTGRKSFL